MVLCLEKILYHYQNTPKTIYYSGPYGNDDDFFQKTYNTYEQGFGYPNKVIDLTFGGEQND